MMMRVHAHLLDCKEAWHLGHRTHTLPTGVRHRLKWHTIRFHDEIVQTEQRLTVDPDSNFAYSACELGKLGALSSKSARFV
jgi:hypothetical protein